MFLGEKKNENVRTNKTAYEVSLAHARRCTSHEIRGAKLSK